MITKTRSSDPITLPPVPGAGTKFGTGGGACVSYPTGGATYTPFTESISYDAGTKRTYKYCDHHKVFLSMNPDGMFSSDQSGFNTGTYCSYDSGRTSDLAAVKAALDAHGCDVIDITAYDVDDHVSDAIRTMWPEVKNRFGDSIINSVIDLHDFVKLPALLPRLTALRSNPNAWKRLTKELGRTRALQLRAGRAAGDFVHWVANANLTYEFGIRSTVLDVMSTLDSIKHAKSEAERLYAYANKPLTSHYFKPLLSEWADVNAETSSPFGYTGTSVHTLTYWRAVTEAWFCATMMYSYSLPHFSKSMATLRALMDSVGFNLNPRIIWDATRMSFLVDWLLHIGDWLDQWKIRALEPTVNITQFGYSVKMVQVRAYKSNWAGIVSSETTRLREEDHRYLRVPIIPPISEFDLQSGSGLRTPFKIGIALSLIAR